MSVLMFDVVCMSPPNAIFVKASHWPSDHMIRSRPLIGVSETCLLDESSEEVHNLQSHDGLLGGDQLKYILLPKV